MRNFKISLKGRIKNFSLPENKSLMPLFEAVVNSLQAIDERKKTTSFNGKIFIKIDREATISDEILGCIEDITITDNGIGFNESNFDSFMESDSEYKEKLGGKGVGRFSWLKAFEKVKVHSNYEQEGEYRCRDFDFSLNSDGIDDEYSVSEDDNSQTIIKLCSFKENYRKNAPKEIETIAIKLIQHCFVYLLEKDCPSIELADNKGNSILINDLFRNKVIFEDGIDTFTIEQKEFTLTKFRVDNAIINAHKIYLCANNRLVDTKDLSKLIVNLDNVLNAEKPFWFLGVVTADYLDENVDMNRLSFTIPETAEDGFVPLVTINKIVTKSVDLIEEYLSEYLIPIAEKKKKRIADYITAKAPQYRHILKYMPEQLDNIKPGISDDKLDVMLYQLDRDFELATKKEGAELVEQLKNDVTQLEAYKSKFQEHIARISDENKSILAKYVAHRKSIIDLFEIGMQKQNDDSYVREKFMHNLIYPMSTTSDEIGYEQHNLWLVDERLAYFFFASSDIPFNNDRSEDRPDIMLFDNSIALLEAQNDGTAYDSCDI